MTTESLLNISKALFSQMSASNFMDTSDVLAGLDNGVLVDVGEKITETSATVEGFSKALCDVLYRLDILVNEYEPQMVQLYKMSAEWGGWLERVTFDFNNIIDDPMFNLVDGKSYADIEHKFYQPKVVAKLFTEAKSIAIPVSMQIDDIRTAFNGMGQYNTFVSGVRAQIVNQMSYLMDLYSLAIARSAICVSCGVLENAVHLVTEGKAKGILSADDDAITSQNNSKFMAYTAERMANVAGYFKRPSKAFNNGSIITWSRKVNLALINDFVNANTYRNLATTFNQQLLKLPAFDTVTAWQGTKSENGLFAFEDLTTVIAKDPANKLGFKAKCDAETGDYTVKNVIGLMYDDRALGITILNTKTTSSYTGATDHTNTFDHLRLNSVLDSNFNMVAFCLD